MNYEKAIAIIAEKYPYMTVERDPGKGGWRVKSDSGPWRKSLEEALIIAAENVKEKA
jgi:hypothetical protein